MGYGATLADGWQLYIDNEAGQTRLTSTQASGGQQQSQAIALSTGSWTVPPTLFRTPQGFILRLEGEAGQTFVQIQAGSLQALSATPPLTSADVMPLTQRTGPVPGAMPPMAPLPPMEMPPMQMQMNPMRMRMGDMEMQMGNAAPNPMRKFCPQCGQPVQVGDRFCSSCGHRLGELTQS